MSALLGLYLRLIIVVGAIGLAALAIKALYEHLLFPALSLLGLLLVMTSAATALISVACLLHPPIAGLVTSKIKVSTRFLRHGSRLWIGVLLSSGLVAAGGHLLSDAATSFQQSMEIARNQW